MPATPPGTTGPSSLMAAEGRQLKSQYAIWRVLVVLALIILAGVDYAARGTNPTWDEFLSSPELRGLATVLGLCFVLYWVRREGIRQFADDVVTTGPRPAPAVALDRAAFPSDDELGQPSGTIICCSGGGIKSASFCLGALQRLDAAGRFNRADTVVAVSGGGYAASAYLAMYRHLDAVALTPVAETPFAPGSRELAELRRRTNYVASAGRARFDLVTSLLFGVAANVVLLAAGVVALAWVMAQHIALVQMVDTTVRPGSSLWALNWSGWSSWWLQVIGPLLLLGIAVLIFCGRRARLALVAREEDRQADARVQSEAAPPAGGATPDAVPVTVPQPQEPHRAVELWTRVVDGGRAAWSKAVSPVEVSDGVRTPFLSKTPNRLLQVAVSLAAVTLGLPWVAVVLHNAMIDGRVVNLPQWVGGVTGITSVASLVALIRSLAKGIGTPLGADGATGRLLEVFRRQVAPALAVALFLLIVFVATAATTAAYMTSASRHELGYVPLAFAIIVPMSLWALGLTNFTTIHPYYRERLSWAYLEHSGAEDPRLADLDPDRPTIQDQPGPRSGARSRRSRAGGLPMSLPGYVSRATETEAQPPPRRPNLVLVATANIQEGDVLPSGRGGTPFILGADTVGLSERTLPEGACWGDTDRYRNDPGGPVRLSAAMAISGAAFAPRAGRESKLIGPYRLLLAFANLRLGVWMPNPYYPTSWSGPRTLGRFGWINERLDRPTSLAVWAEAFGSMPVSAPFLYVTDGGHYDNLGIVESLRRRPSRLIVLDGTGDDEDKFPVVGDAIATVRMDHRIEVDFDPSPLLRGDSPHPLATHVRATARYPGPDGSECDITYIKCALPAGLPWDLEAYRLRNPDFPATTQRFEMFDEFDFEAYRKLGECLVDRAIAAGDLW